MKEIIVVCLMALALSACNTMENKASITRIDAGLLQSQSTGVVVFSTGADETCVSASTFMVLFDQATLRHVPGTAAAPVDGYAQKSDFTDHRGFVSAYALLPGKYYLSPSIANPYIVGVKVPAYPFEIKGGETVYLGEFHLAVGCSLQNALKINDRYERDIGIAVRQNPVLAERAPVKRILANHTAGDGANGADFTPVTPAATGTPIQELFSPPPPPKPGSGGIATLKDVVPQHPETVTPLVMPLQHAAVTEQWTGTMSCGARLDKPSKAYVVPFAMEKRGRDVSVFRKTSTASETLSGQVRDGMMALNGKGTMDDGSRSWGFRFSGPFSYEDNTLTLSGEMLSKSTKVRECILRMMRG